jgi:hypothetical protein
VCDKRVNQACGLLPGALSLGMYGSWLLNNRGAMNSATGLGKYKL